ncbi:MAG: SEC-C metal-binding domain-containing protein, partial [Parcubacteria group bacterium]
GDKEQRWDIREICETVRTLMPVPKDLPEQLERARSRAGTPRQDEAARQGLIDFLYGLVLKVYAAREAQLGPELMRRVELGVYLATIDTLWVDHLDSMEALRESVRLRGYGQRDPLVEYKKDGFSMFEQLLDNVQNGIVYRIFKAGIRLQQTAPTAQAEKLKSAPSGKVARQALVKKTEPGRNDPCPCGSGKKYKKCHGANA